MYRAIDKWLLPYLLRRRRPHVQGVTDLLICVCDHFEPRHEADRATALTRANRWREEFPRLTAPFRDSDGCSPAHTFFYPLEQFDEEAIASLAELCRACHAEVEVHLHHDNDTAENLRNVLDNGKAELAVHGLLSRDPSGEIRYGFIHGDWALNDSHPSGRHCGVRNELSILQETGCYADFTMPSAPDPTQTRTINSIYYAQDAPDPKSHDTGTRMRVSGSVRSPDSRQKSALATAEKEPETGAPARPAGAASPAAAGLLSVQGPLGLNWSRRKHGVLPRLENGELSGRNPPRPDRLRVWTRLGIHVEGRPEWIVVKLHTHGALEENMATLLGDAMRQFYQHLGEAYSDGEEYRVHYVTARELVNILHAAEAGCAGDPGAFRDYRYKLQ